MLAFYQKQLIKNMKDHGQRAVHEFKLKLLHYANNIENMRAPKETEREID